jgi:hypothetical protein
MDRVAHSHRRAAARTVVACTLSWLVCTSQDARAGDIIFTPGFNQSVFVDSNPRLLTSNPRAVIGLAGALTFDLSGLGKDYRLNVNGSLGYRIYGGPGAADINNSLSPSLDVSYAVFDKVQTLTFTTAYARTNADAVDFIEQFPVSVDVGRNTFRAGLKYEDRISEVDTLTTNLGATTTVYDRTVGGLANGWSVETGAQWRHRLTKRIASTLGANLEWRATDNATDLRQLTTRLRASVEAELSARLTAHVGTGIRFLHTAADAPGGVRNSSFSIGALADLGLDYRLKRGKLSTSLSYDVLPNAFGELQNRFSLNGSGAFDLTQTTSAGLSASYQIAGGVNSTGGRATHVFTIGPNLSQRLSKTMDASLGYRLAVSDSNRGRAMSNSFTLGLSGKF